MPLATTFLNNPPEHWFPVGCLVAPRSLATVLGIDVLLAPRRAPCKTLVSRVLSLPFILTLCLPWGRGLRELPVGMGTLAGPRKLTTETLNPDPKP